LKITHFEYKGIIEIFELVSEGFIDIIQEITKGFNQIFEENKSLSKIIDENKVNFEHNFKGKNFKF